MSPVSGGGPTTAADGESLARARRLDWRLLLPDPSPAGVAYLGPPDDGLLAALDDAGWERVPPADGPDLVIVARPTADRLAAAIAAVRPGGWVYVETRGLLGGGFRRRELGPGVVASRLARAGFGQVRRQLQAPPRAPKVIVPLDEPHALRLFLARRRGLPGRGVVTAALELTRRTGLLARLAPRVSLVARRPAAADEPGVAVRDAIGAHLAGLGPAAGGAAVHAPLLLTPRFEASRNVIALVPGIEPGRPAIVVKVARRGTDGAATEREAAGLRLLHGEPDRWPDAPRLLDVGRPWGLPTIVQTAVPGRPLDPVAVARDPERAIELGVGWLASLVERSAAGEPADARLERLVTGPLDRLGAATAGSLDRLVSATRAVAAELHGCHLPRTFEHGDASHPNLILLPGGGLTAVDWELAEPDGLPGHDLVAFLAYVATARAGARTPAEQGEAIATAVVGRAGWSDAAERSYADAIGLDPALLRPLAVIAWARHVAGVVDRLVEGTPEPLGAERVAWIGEHRYTTAWRAAVAGHATAEAAAR